MKRSIQVLVIGLAVSLFALAADIKNGIPDPSPEKATIVFVRATHLLMSSSVLMDGQPIGKNKTNTFFYLEVAPGKHEFISHTMGMRDAKASVNLEAGKTYYFEQDQSPSGGMADPRLRILAPEEAQQLLARAKLSSKQ